MNGSIAYQGEPGANSAAACSDMFPGRQQLPCTTFSDAGRVADIHHLLPDSGLHIVGEYFLPIHFHLMAVPGADLHSIRTVRSHVHALGQCRKIIREHGWATVVSDDTAGAAREVAESGNPAEAALSPNAAAALYGLTILATDVEDEHHNTTRFLVLSADPHTPPVGSGPVITSYVFRVRNIPASLYKAIGGFATNGVNMTKIESYQLGGSFFASQFYIDIEGHPQDPSVALALEELTFFSAEARQLGVYPAHPYRAQIAEPRPTGAGPSN
jgi:prephenate dehydratase